MHNQYFFLHNQYEVDRKTEKSWLIGSLDLWNTAVFMFSLQEQNASLYVSPHMKVWKKEIIYTRYMYMCIAWNILRVFTDFPTSPMNQFMQCPFLPKRHTGAACGFWSLGTFSRYIKPSTINTSISHQKISKLYQYTGTRQLLVTSSLPRVKRLYTPCNIAPSLYMV